MIEARPTSVAPGKAAGTAGGVKGEAAEECRSFPARQFWDGGEDPAYCRESGALSALRALPASVMNRYLLCS